jgi:hypothetical protein
MSANSREHRRRARQNANAETVTVIVSDTSGERPIRAGLLDFSETGLGVSSATPLPVGSLVSLIGPLEGPQGPASSTRRAHVCHSTRTASGAYRSGLAFEYQTSHRTDGTVEPRRDDEFVDLYEVLQVSPNADAETIHRVYRLLAHRYHPDNAESGNEETFKRVLQAYKVLSEPARRAAYDVEHHSQRKLRWKIFDQPQSARGMEAEKRKRWGILTLLYHQRLQAPGSAGIRIMEMEDLLGCPREHLEFTLWVLRGNGWVERDDKGNYQITIQGALAAEDQSGGGDPMSSNLLPAAPTPEPEMAMAY